MDSSRRCCCESSHAYPSGRAHPRTDVRKAPSILNAAPEISALGIALVERDLPLESRRELTRRWRPAQAFAPAASCERSLTSQERRRRAKRVADPACRVRHGRRRSRTLEALAPPPVAAKATPGESKGGRAQPPVGAGVGRAAPQRELTVTGTRKTPPNERHRLFNSTILKWARVWGAQPAV